MSELKKKVTSYGGEAVSDRRDLIWRLVLLAWPKLWETCVLPVEDFVTPELRDDFIGPTDACSPKWGGLRPLPRARSVFIISNRKFSN